MPLKKPTSLAVVGGDGQRAPQCTQAIEPARPLSPPIEPVGHEASPRLGACQRSE
jgi:hypothetical protein